MAPASYDNCIAVAATGPGHTPWPLSASGSAVDVAAPGWGVHVAGFDWASNPPTQVVARSSGTSYAVAPAAGVAGLWLAFHGWSRLVKRYGAGRVQGLFVHLLRHRAVQIPDGWDEAYGSGVIDAEALLKAPLPEPADLPADVRPRGAADEPATRLAALAGSDPTTIAAALERLLVERGVVRSERELIRLLRRFEGELAYLIIENAAFREALLAAGAPGQFSIPPIEVPPGSSTRLQALLSGAQRS